MDFLPLPKQGLCTWLGPTQEALQASAGILHRVACLAYVGEASGLWELACSTWSLCHLNFLKFNLNKQTNKNERPLLEHPRPVAKCLTKLMHGAGLARARGPGRVLLPSSPHTGVVPMEDWSPQLISYANFHCVHSLCPHGPRCHECH